MAWFEEWFNTPYYHLLYGKRDEQEAAFFLDNLLKQLDLPAGARCWDLNCGKGRHSVYLSKKGFDVTGTDLSEASISCARHSENAHLHFYKHDMRNLFYTNYFDAVLNLFTSFGYFRYSYEDDKVFQSVFNALKPKGKFVLDFFNAAKVMENLKELDEKIVGEVIFRIRKKIEDNVIIKEITVEDQGRKSEFREKVKIFTETEFVLLAEKTGLQLKSTFGSYALDPFDARTSDRLILIFEK